MIWNSQDSNFLNFKIQKSLLMAISKVVQVNVKGDQFLIEEAAWNKAI